ncbi:MAG TPA: hypothetical protein VK864_14020 [Longimicrobiales bacterium]|nr:hypothetical protein [Longimicrobiales bacterium]
MDTHTAYCSARDQEVHIAWLDYGSAGEPPSADAAVVCLDYGQECSGALCPAFGLPSILMGARLARSGLPTHQWRTVRAACVECGQLGELKVLSSKYLYCTVCGTTLRWREIEAAGEAYAALAGAG